MFLDKLLKVKYCAFQTHQMENGLSSDDNVLASLHFSWPPEAALSTVLTVILLLGDFTFFFCFASSYCVHAFSHMMLSH